MVRLKITNVGNSLAVVLPHEVLASLKVGDGDTLYLTEAPTGYMLSTHDPEVQEQLRVAREVMDTHRDVLRALSKL
jgi:putative addiction module antidote